MPCSTLFIDHIHRLFNKIIVLLHNSPMDKICTHIKYMLDKGGKALYFYYMPKSTSFLEWVPPITHKIELLGETVKKIFVPPKLHPMVTPLTPTKVTFLIESYKLDIHFSWWWFNRKCTCQDGGCRHLGFRKSAAISLVFYRLSPKLVKTLGLVTYWLRRNYIFVNIQDGGRRHLEFRKTVAISLLFDQSSPDLGGILLLWFRTHRWRQKI